MRGECWQSHVLHKVFLNIFFFYSQRAILKFAAHTGATPIAGRFTPGTFTNQIQAAFREPRLLVISDPRVDHQVLYFAVYKSTLQISRLLIFDPKNRDFYDTLSISRVLEIK